MMQSRRSRLILWLPVIAASLLCSGCVPRDAGQPRRGGEDPDLDNVTMLLELRRYLESVDDLRRSTAAITTSEMREADISFLETALRGSYGGYDLAEKEGFSWYQAFASLRQEAGDLTSSDWQNKIRQALGSLSDRHLAIMGVANDGSFVGWTSIVERNAVRFELSPDCRIADLPQPQPYFVDGVPKLSQRVIVVAASAPVTPGCSWTEVENPPRNRAAAPSVRALANDFHIVSVHSFAGRDSAMWNSFKATAEQLRAGKTLVIDLRGNTGGDDHEFYRWLMNLVGYKPKTAVFERLSSPWVSLNLVNFFTGQIAFNLGDEAWQQHVRDYRKLYLDQLAEVTSDKLNDRNWDVWDRAATEPEPIVKSPFTGQIVALIDRYCSSACELAVKTLRNLPRITLVGENTLDPKN